jgi:hypothetical protein
LVAGEVSVVDFRPDSDAGVMDDADVMNPGVMNPGVMDEGESGEDEDEEGCCCWGCCCLALDGSSGV